MLYAALLALSGVGFSTSRAAEKRRFAMFDGLLYTQKPDLGQFGLEPIAGSGNLWRPGQSHLTVDESGVQSAIEPFRGHVPYFYLDIEDWPLQGVPTETRAETIAKLIRLADIARVAAGETRIGFYGLMPGITYWPLVSRMLRKSEYQDWKETNEALEDLAPHVDAVFPSLYTFYDDLTGWQSYARQSLLEARRYSKPVYAFLWPEFHDSNALLRGQLVPARFWRAELELCFELADGIVIWGGYQQTWKGDAPWWQETQLFINGQVERA